MSVNKSVANDFSGNFNASNYAKDIQASSIAKTLLKIERNGDNVLSNFNTALSTAENTTLNGLVTNHNANNYKYNDLEHIIKANLCDATTKEGNCVYVSDATTSGGILCFSNGTDWIRCDNLNPV